MGLENKNNKFENSKEKKEGEKDNKENKIPALSPFFIIPIEVEKGKSLTKLTVKTTLSF